jgi:outer membrane protein TolC
MPGSFEDCWARARKGRPSIASAAAREEAASFLVDAQVAALYPSLSLGLGWSASGPTTPLPWSLQAGPSLSWVPFDGFQRLATIDEATASLKSARADRALAEQQAWLDTRAAFLALEDAKRRVELTALVVRSAEENVRLAQGRFEVGKGTTVELTDAQQALTQARADSVQAQADGDLASARMLRALGATGRETREDAPPPGRKP